MITSQIISETWLWKVLLTRDFFLIAGKGGPVLQKLYHIIYSFLYHDFHPLIDRNFSMSIILSFFYSVFFFFLSYWLLLIFSCVLYCYKECWMRVLPPKWYLFLLWPKVKMSRNNSAELKDIFAFKGYCQIVHWYLYFLIIQWLVSFMSLVVSFF